MEPVRVPTEKNESGLRIVSNSSSGPTFRDYDGTHTYSAYLHISDNANSSRSNCCYLDENVMRTKGKPRELFFTGTDKFSVDDYEVFEFF